MRYIYSLLCLFFFTLTLAGPAPGSAADNLPYAIMRPDPATILAWQDRAKKAPRAFLDPDIRAKLRLARDLNTGSSASVLSRLTYNAAERNQANCGNCWVWAGQGAAGIELNRLTAASDRLSVQFLNSCDLNQNACCGGTLGQFADWYRQKGLFVPWSNTGGGFGDGQRGCGSASPQQCSLIATTPHYGINTINAETVATTGVDQATAIDNMKNVLNQGRAIWFGFFLPDQASWDHFMSFWENQGEESVYSLDAYCGQAWNEYSGGGHAVLIVGYNDDDPANRYWVVLNSWGTAGGNRPHGLFRVNMDMNYQCGYSSVYGNIEAFTAQTLNIQFAGSGNCSYAISPPAASFAAAGGQGVFTVNTDNNCSWSAAASTGWITLLAGGSGQGTAEIRYQVAANSGATRSGVIQVGGQKFTITQGAGVNAGEVLKNPGFELGENGDWTVYPGSIIWSYPCYQQFGSLGCAREGEKLAWLGGYDNAYDYAYQDVTIAADATEVTLSFWYGIETNDLLSTAYDFLQVSVIRLRDSATTSLMTLDNTNTTTDWVHSPRFDLSGFRGETIRLQFLGTTDSSYFTNFFIDDVRLTVTHAGGSPKPVVSGGPVIAPVNLLLLR